MLGSVNLRAFCYLLSCPYNAPLLSVLLFFILHWAPQALHREEGAGLDRRQGVLGLKRYYHQVALKPVP